MSAAVLVLPQVWACEVLLSAAEAESTPLPVRPEVAFYRKYTEALLRRYVAMSMEAGRTPSLLGKEMFRAKVTNVVVRSFEDVVIFVHDMAKCMAKLDREQQMLIHRIGLQQYTQAEVAAMLGQPTRTVVRRYNDALDRLTRLLLLADLLEVRKFCQEADLTENHATD
jgi:hypothetical protein